jgi:hypothetical protein
MVMSVLTRAPRVKNAPLALPRRFWLLRHVDVSGVSGTGKVAEGVLFSTGMVAVNWCKPPYAVGLFPSLEAVQRVHGHKGQTELIWLDQGPPSP